MQYFSWKGGELAKCEWSERGARALMRISLCQLKSAYASTGWPTVEPDEAFDNLNDVDTIVVFVDELIVCVSVAQPWFSAEPVITEEFVDAGVPLATVVAICEFVARSAGISRILVGTRAAPNQRHAGLAQLYSREGMVVSTVELMRVVE